MAGQIPVGYRARGGFGMPIVTYFIFERWFLVPLPKGPVEEWLGL